MRFAFVTTNLRGGGAEKAVLKLAALLAERGHETRVVLLEDRVEHAIPAGVQVESVTPPGKSAAKGWLGKRLMAWRLGRRLSAAGNWDLIVSTLPYADEVAALSGLPRVRYRIANTLSAEIAALNRENPDKAARRAARYRKLYGKRALVAVSQGVAADLVDSFGATPERVATIYNPFDPEAIRKAAQEPCPARPAGPYLLHVGRFMPQKRHDLLLEAYSRSGLSQPLVLLTSPSPELSRLIAEKSLEERVRVVGFQTNPYPWMAGADLLVLSSDREGMPNVLVEALLCGIPVVSTDCPSGPAEVLTGPWKSYLVPCDDSLALAEAMKKALATPMPELPPDLEKFYPLAIAAAYERLAGMGA